MAKTKLKKIPGHDNYKEISKKTKKNKSISNTVMKKNKEKKKINFNINYKKILIVVVILFVISFAIYKLLNIRIKNIYIEGNSILSDQEIIDSAKLRDYPKTFHANSKKIKKDLEKNVYIKSAKVTKSSFFSTVNIKIEENKPLIYYNYNNKVILADYTFVSDYFDVPILVNQTPEDILKKLLEEMNKIDYDIIGRISEIEYVPNEVDDNLFLLKMSDGNYVYINIKTFKKINNYLDMVMTFDNKKGILHLDSGDYFTIINDDEKVI